MDMKIATRSNWLAHVHSCRLCTRHRLCPTGLDRFRAMQDFMSDGESLPAWLTTLADASAQPVT